MTRSGAAAVFAGLVSTCLALTPTVLPVHAADKPAATQAADAPLSEAPSPDTPKPHRKARRTARTRLPATVPQPAAADRAQSQRAVCQSQCNLERMSCDQGRAAAFQNRADQLQAAQSNCYLAIQGCLSRC